MQHTGDSVDVLNLTWLSCSYCTATALATFCTQVWLVTRPVQLVFDITVVVKLLSTAP